MRHSRSNLLVPLAATLIGASTLLAQPAQDGGGGGGGIGMNIQSARDKGKKLEPPTLNYKSNESATWPMIATLLFIGAGLLAAIIPSKRGHQD